MALLCKEFVRRWPGRAGNQTGSQAGHGDLVRGRIINMSSGQGITPMPGELAYIATKGAVEAFTTSLAAGVAQQGITVNAIDPGPVDTGWMDAELKTQLLAQAPLGRIGLPQDIANLICFLASAEADWITGQVLHARGGL
jgi:3-oxoacyl-[acyl-carrier protein] reductase